MMKFWPYSILCLFICLSVKADIDDPFLITRQTTQEKTLIHSISGANRVKGWLNLYFKEFKKNKRPPMKWFHDFKSSIGHGLPGIWSNSVARIDLKNLNYKDAKSLSVDSWLRKSDPQILVGFHIKGNAGWWINNKKQRELWKSWKESNFKLLNNKFSVEQTTDLKQRRIPYHSEFYEIYQVAGYIKGDYPVILNPDQIKAVKLLIPKGVLNLKRNKSFFFEPVYCDLNL